MLVIAHLANKIWYTGRATVLISFYKQFSFFLLVIWQLECAFFYVSCPLIDGASQPTSSTCVIQPECK